jgi:hypothetical protein
MLRGFAQLRRDCVRALLMPHYNRKCTIQLADRLYTGLSHGIVLLGSAAPLTVASRHLTHSLIISAAVEAAAFVAVAGWESHPAVARP